MYEFFIAKRYLKSRRKTRFISAITYISIGGVALGVAALIIVLSLMNGFATEIRDRLVGMYAHVRVVKFHGEGIEDYKGLAERLEGMRHVLGVSPVIDSKAMIFSRRSTDGVMVRGADEDDIGKVSDLGENLLYGDIELDEPPGRNSPGAVLGNSLVDRLGVTLGDTLYLVGPQNLGIASTWGVPKTWRFVVTGVFETGFYDFDTSLAIISIPSAQRVFGLDGEVTGLEIKLDDMYKAKSVAKKIENMLKYPYHALSWIDMNKHLYSWMTIEKWGSFIVLSLIVLVAAFNIASTLIMVVLEKTKEIGILKAMGAAGKSIQRIFVLEGMVVGVVGTILGCAIGYALCWVQDTFKIISLPAEIYIISAVPVDVRGFDFLWISSLTLVICFLASLYPARKAASLDPVEAIRYE